MQTEFPAEAQLMDSVAEVRALLAGGMPVHLKLPIAFGTADGTVLATVPSGFVLEVQSAYWEVTTSFTGGSSSTIAVNSDDTGYTAGGAIMGGTGGDAAATLVSTGQTYKGGTVGGAFASNGKVVLAGGKQIKFQRITSAFTAGAGFVHITGRLIAA